MPSLNMWDVLLPAYCVGCEKPPSPCCEECRPIARPKLTNRGELEVAVAVELDQTVARLVTQFKDHAQLALVQSVCNPISAALDLAVLSARPLAATTRPAITWVPSSGSARRRRGFEPNRLLLEKTMRWRIRRGLAGFPLARALTNHSGRRDQTGLSRSDRFGNTEGMFKAQGPPRDLLLFDDILTTGATMGSAVAALREADMRVLGCFALAETRLKMASPGE